MDAPVKKDVAAQTVISMRHTGSHDEIGQVYRRLHEWARKKKVAAKGPGMTIFHVKPSEFDPEGAQFEVCLPVTPGAKGDSAVQVRQVPACSVYAVTVKGPYSKIPAHYAELLAWMSAEGLHPAGAPREVYIKRPKSDGSGDPAEFVTEIQFPVE